MPFAGPFTTDGPTRQLSRRHSSPLAGNLSTCGRFRTQDALVKGSFQARPLLPWPPGLLVLNKAYTCVCEREGNFSLLAHRHSKRLSCSEVVLDKAQNVPYDVLLTTVDLGYGQHGLYSFYKMQVRLCVAARFGLDCALRIGMSTVMGDLLPLLF